MNTTSATPSASPAPPVESWWSRAFFALWPAGAIVLVDQLSKIAIQKNMEPGASVHVLGTVVQFTHQLNAAGAMSIRLGPPSFYLVVTAAVVIFLAWSLVQKPLPTATRWALLLVLGGAVGNMIDRIRLGAVIDFIDVEFIDFSMPAIDLGPIHVPGEVMTRWPVFNVADACVTSGIVLLILATFIFDRHYAAQGDSD